MGAMTIALFGAGGDRGIRIADNLKLLREYRILCIESDPAGQARLAERNLAAAIADDAVREADVVILALPNPQVGPMSYQVVPLMKSGGMLMTLDPAPARAGVLATRQDISRFVACPCHPPLWNDELGEARKDFVGGIAARQNVVCAMENGRDEDYRRGEELVQEMFSPVTRVHRITVDQMAMLKPALADTVVALFCTAIRNAMDAAAANGVPPQVVQDFAMGHVNYSLATVFGHVPEGFSPEVERLIQYGRQRILTPSWKDIFHEESLKEQVQTVVYRDR